MIRAPEADLLSCGGQERLEAGRLVSSQPLRDLVGFVARSITGAA